MSLGKADNARCSEIGALVLRAGGDAVDAAVSVALCGGVVNSMASGIGMEGRGAHYTISTQNMYQNNLDDKYSGALSMGVPGEIAGLYKAWLQHGRMAWKTLFQSAISLAKDGFTVAPYLATIAEEGPEAFYSGTIGEKLISDVRSAGGILTMEDLRNYEVIVTDAVEVMGFKILGMPPPSSGTLGLAFVLNILNSYENTKTAKGQIGLHRFIEALKHTFAIRINLGDPDFVDIICLWSCAFTRWSQIEDHGTSHFCIVDADRNAVSMTTTVNYPFGGGILSPTTGIVLNNEMGDFLTPTEISPDSLPPSPTNFISPNKRPLSSMTPVIVVKGDQLVGVIGGSGGMYIIPAVIQVFLNHFILGMEPLDAVQSPRVYRKTQQYFHIMIDVDHTELLDDRKKSLRKRGHVLQSKSGGAVSQLIVQTLKKPIENRRVSYNHKQVLKGMLTAISDPRKDVKRSGLCRLGEKQKEIPVKLLCLAAVSVSKPKSTNEMK
ncbi:gamma-glutamyltranspeptidase 3-like protein isoform X1 [Tanacetum coccineum]